jgi:alpha-1,3-rhamnosyl/mannosyltransferase
MRIAVDARWIFPQLSGVGVYTRELLRAWAQAATGPEFLVIFADAEREAETRAFAGLDGHPRFRTAVFPHGVFSLASQWRLPGWLRRHRVDWFFSPNWMVPVLPGLGRGFRVAVTLHDLIPVVLRDHAPASRKARAFPVYLGLLRWIARRADRLFTVSEASRADILRHLLRAGAADRITVAYNGVSPRFTPNPAVARRPVILYVGRFDPYKNVPSLVEAFARACPRLPPDVRLRLVGNPDPRYPETAQAIARSGRADRIDWDAGIRGGDLPEVYQSATVLVQPSRYEGFGLPVVEAMACGTPVICTTAASLPEIAGDAARLVPTGDGEALTEAIVQAFRDPAWRAQASERGLRQAARFSWSTSAQQHLAALGG